MTGPAHHVGKQNFYARTHVADATDLTAARQIVDALNAQAMRAVGDRVGNLHHHQERI